MNKLTRWACVISIIFVGGILGGCEATVPSGNNQAELSWDDGVAAHRKGNYATALQVFRPLAEQGDVRAQYNLGLMFEKGQGIPQDDKEAATWYMKAAYQGFMHAQYNLGVMYENGRGVPRDYKEAVRWHRHAAEQGYVLAQYNLGGLYMRGLGVPQDHHEAMKLFVRAAEQGESNAQNNLGAIYGNGLGVPKDYVQAQKWFYIAVANGNKGGIKNRDIFASMMTPAQIAEAQMLAKEWMEQHQ